MPFTTGYPLALTLSLPVESVAVLLLTISTSNNELTVSDVLDKSNDSIFECAKVEYKLALDWLPRRVFALET